MLRRWRRISVSRRSTNSWIIIIIIVETKDVQHVLVNRSFTCVFTRRRICTEIGFPGLCKLLSGTRSGVELGELSSSRCWNFGLEDRLPSKHCNIAHLVHHHANSASDHVSSQNASDHVHGTASKISKVMNSHGRKQKGNSHSHMHLLLHDVINLVIVRNAAY